MMPVTIDPSEAPNPASPAPHPARPRLRLVLLSGLGVLGLAGFTALASSVLGGLAGPQVPRATIKTAAVSQKASDWPDLRDGVPALAPIRPLVEKPPLESSASEKPTPPVASPPPIQARAPIAVPEQAPLPAALTPAEAPPQKRAEPAAAQKPARLPLIENAAVLPPARPASLVPPARTTVTLAPSPAETTRSRATSGTFTALPPEREAPKRKPPAPVAQAAKPTSAKVAAANAAPATPVAEAEPETTEVFGLKVPSLAPAGRRFAEGVEALGNAVKNLPDRF